MRHRRNDLYIAECAVQIGQEEEVQNTNFLLEMLNLILNTYKCTSNESNIQA